MAGELSDNRHAAAAVGPVAPGVPSAVEGLLADRQAVWGTFTKVVLWSTIVIAASLVVIVWAVL